MKRTLPAAQAAAIADDSLGLSRVAILKRWLRRTIVSRAMCRSPMVAFCAPADGIGVEVLASGTFEGEYLDLLKIILERLGLQGNLLAIDVGANIGTHAIFFSKLFTRVVAFEPNPAVFLVCKANQIWSGQNNVEVFDIALSNVSGHAMLYTPQNGHFGWASLDHSEGRRGAIVRMERGDEFIPPLLHQSERVALIKIDVERHEAQVIEGLSGLISRHRPLVLFESLSASNFERSRAVLDDCGYGSYYSIERTWDGAQALGKCLALFRRTKIFLNRCEDRTARRQTAIIAIPRGAGTL